MFLIFQNLKNGKFPYYTIFFNLENKYFENFLEVIYDITKRFKGNLVI